MRLIKRAEFGWGVSAASRATPTKGLVIHYDGSRQNLAGKDHSACVTYWKSTRRFHMGPSRKWSDIGYSYGACPHGFVFEGRGLNRIQAAQPTGNSTWYSCTLMSGPGEAPTAAQIEAVRELREWLMGKGVGALVKGHRDFYSTDCPGSLLYAMVRDGTFTKTPGKPTAPADTSWTETLVKDLPLLKPGDDNYDVKSARGLLNARGYLPEAVYATVGLKAWLDRTKYDPEFAGLVRGFQRLRKLDDDALIGPATWAALARAS